MITINGKTYQGNSVQITGDKIIIDGKEVNEDSKKIDVVFNYPLENFEIENCNTVTINGDCTTVTSKMGTLKYKEKLKEMLPLKMVM